MISRRRFGIITVGALFTACVEHPPTSTAPTTFEPTQPTPSATRTLLAAVQAAGHSATAQRTGSASVILINGSKSWNFRINDQLVGIGAPVDPPTFNLADLIVPTDAKLSVVGA